MSDTDADAVEDGPVQFMRQMVSLDYFSETTPLARHFGEQLAKHEIIGHKCPECGLVYVPPRGFCPLCVATTSDADEVPVSSTGTVTAFTVLTPIQYYGQEEREDYTLANILLDGADQTIGQQRLGGIANEDVRAGLRVELVWKDEIGPDVGRGGLGAAVDHWRPAGEPDVDPTHFREHVL